MTSVPTFFRQMTVEFPSGPVPLDSNLYVERPPIEQLIYQEISTPGSVIRIKAPKRMGKSSLLLRLLHQAEKLNYRTVYIDFLQADNDTFASLDKFLRWFCAVASRQLQMQPMLDDYWDEDIGSKVSCTIYFQGYLLEEINDPLVLALNEVNRIFEYPHIAQEFLSLLRSWCEEAKQNERLQKLRLVLIHSTEVYISFNINQSPFNIGLPIKLPEFSLAQVQDLARRHGLKWKGSSQAKKLIGMVGGHPYLVRLALYYLVTSPGESLDLLLAAAPTITGIYSEHLQGHLVGLQNNSALAAAFKRVISTDSGVKLDPMLAYKLEGMGLVKLEGDRSIVACDLYRQFFAQQSFEETDLHQQIEQLQQQIKQLQELSYTDELTQVANRRYFDLYLEQIWQKLGDKMAPLALILCEIDFFKVYNDRQGQLAADDCLRQVASTISEFTSGIDHLVARYQWAEFGIILPGIEVKNAFNIAEGIRLKVKQLEIPYNLPQMGGFPSKFITISLGVGTIIPNRENSPEVLTHAVVDALYEARRNGCDRTEVSSTLNDDFRANG